MSAPSDPDGELRSRLRASDPAAALPPADPHRVTRLLEDVMATELTTENRETGTRERGPLTWLVAAAAVLVIAGIGIVGVRALAGDDATPTPTAVDPAPSAVTELEVSAAAGAAKCMVPNAEALSGADVAFDGTVTAIDGDLVRITPSKWYVGEPTETVEVTAPSRELQEVASGVVFRTGERYLVSATSGQVSLCGFSAPYSHDLQALYSEAFPG
jgi:hypothetical protein